MSEGESQIGKQGILRYTIYIYTYVYVYIYVYIHTLHCIALHYIALHCITLHYITHIYIYTCVCAIFAGYNLDFFAAVRVRHLCPVPVAKLARLDGPDFCRGFVMKREGLVFFSPWGPLGP